jgi:hypothetical protein
MTDEMDFGKFFEDLRKSASVKAGAIMFGEAQSAYFDVLKQHMSEEEAFNMLAHTTECIIKGFSAAVGPLTAALLQANFLMDRFGSREMTDKEMPGGN